jgi:hypothetical protein
MAKIIGFFPLVLLLLSNLVFAQSEYPVLVRKTGNHLSEDEQSTARLVTKDRSLFLHMGNREPIQIPVDSNQMEKVESLLQLAKTANIYLVRLKLPGRDLHVREFNWVGKDRVRHSFQKPSLRKLSEIIVYLDPSGQHRISAMFQEVMGPGGETTMFSQTSTITFPFDYLVQEWQNIEVLDIEDQSTQDELSDFLKEIVLEEQRRGAALANFLGSQGFSGWSDMSPLSFNPECRKFFDQKD